MAPYRAAMKCRLKRVETIIVSTLDMYCELIHASDPPN